MKYFVHVLQGTTGVTMSDAFDSEKEARVELLRLYNDGGVTLFSVPEGKQDLKDRCKIVAVG